jgi:hypothetical protein
MGMSYLVAAAFVRGQSFSFSLFLFLGLPPRNRRRKVPILIDFENKKGHKKGKRKNLVDDLNCTATLENMAYLVKERNSLIPKIINYKTF